MVYAVIYILVSIGWGLSWYTTFKNREYDLKKWPVLGNKLSDKKAHAAKMTVLAPLWPVPIVQYLGRGCAWAGREIAKLHILAYTGSDEPTPTRDEGDGGIILLQDVPARLQETRARLQDVRARLEADRMIMPVEDQEVINGFGEVIIPPSRFKR